MFIYIHLPFCLSHCIYCDFYVELKATDDRRRGYLDALKREISHALSNRPLEPIQTLYLGGGTPALFSAGEIGEILAHLREFTSFSPDVEITLEANPDKTASPLMEYRQAGINRLSIGVQSFQPTELKRLSRVHSRDDVYQLIDEAKSAGFSNISIDLMYGIPEQTPESWQDTLRQMVSLEIPHLSMYGLKVETGTRLDALVAQGRMSLPGEDDTVGFYETAITTMGSSGYAAYEISNLAKPGFESRHNLAYWDNREFWGFGVSAHGYIDAIRYENPRNLEAYLTSPETRHTEHRVSPQEALENALIFGLRKRRGVYLPDLEARYDFNYEQKYGQKALKKYHDTGLLILTDGWLSLSPEAIPVSNSILAEFISL